MPGPGGNRRGSSPLYEAYMAMVVYFQEEFPLDAKWFFNTIIVPLVVGYLVLHGSIGVLTKIWKLMFPPGAAALHRSALGALHHNKRIKRDQTIQYKEAEKLLQQAIAKDESFFPAYLTLASLYIYRMKDPDKALETLKEAKERGPLNKLNPLILDAKALKQGDIQMVQAGGAMFQEHEYLSFPDR